MSFFGVGGNPFATQVGQLIDQATDVSLASENWALNMEICDIINETDDGPKDAIRAIRKKLNMSVAKNYQVVMYTLTVLETCVKNCGKRFHVQVAHKDFLQELVKVIGPKNDPPQVVQEKILSLIQTWADAFRGQPELKEVGRVYQDLKNKGIEFPMTDLDAMAPIHTPARTTPQVEPTSRTPQRAPSSRATQPVQQIAADTGPVHLNPEQLAKLRSELDVVQQNCKVLGEMLTSMTPNQEDPTDLELLQELHRTCRQMQQRLVELIGRVQNEEVTEELLRVNDDLNNVFLRYDRFQRNKPAPATQQNTGTLPIRGVAEGPPAYNSVPPAPASAGDSTAVANLIDLDTAPTSNSDIHLSLAGMNLGGNSVSSTLGQINTTTATNAAPAKDQDEFDMFAQSRQSFETNRQAPCGNTYANQQVDQFQGGLGAAVNVKATTKDHGDELGHQVPDRPSDMEEMEQWLRENDQENVGPPGESATSSEFDRFLAERAKEAENLPDINPANSRGNPRGGRQLQKDDQENALFAL